MARRPTYEEELKALTQATAEPRSAPARAAIASALASKRSLLVARAARLVREHALDGFGDALRDAFARFVEPKSDPMCHARLAALEALDYGESMDASPFLRALGVVQWEGGNDSGAGVRARGIVALARIGHDDFAFAAARLVADGQAPVRQAALEALAHRGERAGGALALYKLVVGDDDPLVTLAAMTTLLTLAPELALEELRARLDGDDDSGRELAATALGQCKRDEALTALLDALAQATRAAERAPLYRALGLHRSERALATLLDVVAAGAAADAETAAEALTARRFEPGIGARVAAAAARNNRAPALAARVAELFAT